MNTVPRFADQRGAIIIHVAIALLVLIAFSAFVVDSGAMWVSRRQAQNVADAGALAGAVALMRDGGGRTEAGKSAHHWSAANPIFGQGNSTANVWVTFSGSSADSCGTSCDVRSIPPCGDQAGCVRVDVFRNMPDRPERGDAPLGDPIPTFFGRMVGITEQGVRATATAQIGSGNAVRCMLPFAVMDRWADNYDPTPDTTYWSNDPLPGTAGWTPNDQYESTQGDVYIGPYAGNTNHTGWTLERDYGRQLILKFGNTGNYSTGWSNRVDLPGSTGGADYGFDIRDCNPTVVGIANADEPCAPAPGGDTTGREINGCISASTGVTQGQTRLNINRVVDDPDADSHYWSPTAEGPLGQTGAVVDGAGVVRMDSSRIRPLAVLDINHYIASGCTGTNCIGKVANIIGFFLEGMCGDVAAAGLLEPGMGCETPNRDVVGRIVTLPGTYAATVGSVENDAAFIQVVRLVR
jgi:hypothetical protein